MRSARGWILENPCTKIDKLVNEADEKIRERPEQAGELEAILNQCSKRRRLHIRYWIICAIETGARTSEVDGIERRDVLFDEKVIRLRVTTTKTQEERYVPLTGLLEASLREWFEIIPNTPYWKKRVPDDPEARIFGRRIRITKVLTLLEKTPASRISSAKTCDTEERPGWSMHLSGRESRRSTG